MSHVSDKSFIVIFKRFHTKRTTFLNFSHEPKQIYFSSSPSFQQEYLSYNPFILSRLLSHIFPSRNCSPHPPTLHHTSLFYYIEKKLEYLAYLYKFEVFLERLQSSPARTKPLSIIWKKGKKTAQTPKHTPTPKGIICPLHQSLILNLKAYKDPDSHDWIPRFSTFSICQHENSRRLTLSETKFNIISLIIGSKKEFTLAFDCGVRLVMRGQQQLLMQLSQFRGALEESEEEVVMERVENVEISNEEEVNLRKNIEDLNYLNGKMRNQKEKMALRVREVEFEAKEREKMILREIRHAKTYYQKKIKIRQNLYQEQIQRLVSQCNDLQTQFSHTQDHLHQQILQLRLRNSKSQSQILQLRDSTSKLRLQLQLREQSLRQMAADSSQQSLRVAGIIHGLQEQLLKVRTELMGMVMAITKEKDEAVREGVELEGLSRRVTEEIGKKMQEIEEREREIEELRGVCRAKEESIRKVGTAINGIEEMLTMKLKQTQTEKTQVTVKLHEVIVEKQDFETRLQRLLTDRDGIMQKLQNMLLQKQKAQWKLNTTQRDLTATKQDLSLCQTTLQQLKKQHQRILHQVVANQTSQLQQKQSLLTTLQSQFSMKQHEHLQDIDDLKAALDGKQAEIYEVKNRERMLESDKQNLEQEIKHITELRNIAQENHQRMVDQNTSLKQELDKLYIKNKKTNSELLQAQDQSSRLKTQLGLKQIALTGLKQALQTANNQLSQQQYQRQQLQYQLTRYDNHGQGEGSKDPLLLQIQTLQAENSKIRRELQQTRVKLQKGLLEDSKGESVEVVRAQLQDARNSVLLLKKELEAKEQVIREWEGWKPVDMRMTADRMIRDGNAEGIRQMIAEKDRQIANANKQNMEFQEKVKQLEVKLKQQGGQGSQIQQQPNLKQSQTLPKKAGDMAVAQSPDLNSQKLRELLKQQNQDHEAQRNELLNKLAEQDAIIEEMKRTRGSGFGESPGFGKSSGFGASRNQYTTPQPPEKFSQKYGAADPYRILQQLQKKLQIIQTEKNKFMNIASDLQKQLQFMSNMKNEDNQQLTESIIRKPPATASNSHPPSYPPPPQPRQSTPSTTTISTPDLQRQLQKKQSDLSQLQSQYSRLQSQLSDRQSQIRDLQLQLSQLKEQQLQAKYQERERKVREEALQVELEKGRERERRLEEELVTKGRRSEGAAGDRVAGQIEKQRELERLKLEAMVRQRELAEAKKDKQQAVRQLRDVRQSKRPYNDDQTSNSLLKQLSKAKDTEHQLKSQLQRLSEERKQKYIRISQHKQQKSQLQRIIRQKLQDLDKAQKLCQQAIQSKIRLECHLKTLQSQLQQCRKRSNKCQQQQKLLLQQKQSQLRLLKKKHSSLHQQMQDLQSQTTQLQQRLKSTTKQHQHALNEINKKALQQLRQGLSQKQQAEIVADELKSARKRQAEAMKMVGELEERVAVLTRQRDEQGRDKEKLMKELEVVTGELGRERGQGRKVAEEVRRQAALREELEREKRDYQQQIQKLEKAANTQQQQIKKLNKQIEKLRSKANETQQDQMSNSKGLKLQLQKSQQIRRKLQKLLTDKQQSLKILQLRLHRLQQSNVHTIQSLNSHYTQKLSLYVSQIQTIKKTIHQYQQQITSLKANNRELTEQLQQALYKINLLETDVVVAAETIEEKTLELGRKREELERLKEEKYEIEGRCARAMKEGSVASEEKRRMEERVARLMEENRGLGEQVEKREAEVRTHKSTVARLEHQLSGIRGTPQRCRQLESLLRKLQSQRQQLLADITHKTTLVYSQSDFQKFQQSLCQTLTQQHQLQLQQSLNRQRIQSDQLSRRLQLQMVQLLNEVTRTRSDLEMYKEHNANLLSESARAAEKERQAVEAVRREMEGVWREKEREKEREVMDMRREWERRVAEAEGRCAGLELEVGRGKREREELQVELERVRKVLEEQAQHIKKSQQKGLQVLHKQNQDLRNKILQLQFQNSRLRQSQLSLQSTHDHLLLQLQHSHQQQLQHLSQTYASSIQHYDHELEQLRASLDQLKYVLEDRNQQLEFRREQVQKTEQELVRLSEEMQRNRVKANEERERYDLEMFRMAARLRESQEQWVGKVRRLEEEQARLIALAQQNTSRIEMSYSKARIQNADDKLCRKYEEKLRLKEKAIEQLKDQLLVLQQKLFRLEHQRKSTTPNTPNTTNNNLQPLKLENSRLKSQLQQLHLLTQSTPTTLKLQQQLTHLNESILCYKRDLTKSKKTQQDLKQKVEQLLQQQTSLMSENAFLKGYENSYKELKGQFERMNAEMRGIMEKEREDWDRERRRWAREREEMMEVVREGRGKVVLAGIGNGSGVLLPPPVANPQSQSSTTKIRQSLQQYRQQLNKRQSILTQQLTSTKQSLLTFSQLSHKLQLDKQQLLKKNANLTTSIALLSEQNLRLSQEVFRLNSNNLKEEFVEELKHESLRDKWLEIEREVMRVTGRRLEEGVRMLVEDYGGRGKELEEELWEVRGSSERRVAELQRQLAETQQRHTMREQQSKFDRQRDALDIAEYTKQIKLLQQTTQQLSGQLQHKQSLQLSLQRTQYQHNNCRIILQLCRSQLQQLKRSYRVNLFDDSQLKQQVISDLDQILDKAYQR